MEAQILEQQHLARSGQHRLYLRTDAVGSHRHRPAEQLRQARGNGFQAHLRIGFALGPPEVARQDHARALFERVSDGRQGSPNPFVAGDFLPAIRERNVKVYADEDAFSRQIQIADGKCAHVSGSDPQLLVIFLRQLGRSAVGAAEYVLGIAGRQLAAIVRCQQLIVEPDHTWSGFRD